MFKFKPYNCYINKVSPYKEGDDNEDMEAHIHVYTEDEKDYKSTSIFVRIVNGKSYFRVNGLDEHFRFDCLRASAMEVIKQCSEKLKHGVKYKDIEYLDGIAHNTLESLMNK